MPHDPAAQGVYIANQMLPRTGGGAPAPSTGGSAGGGDPYSDLSDYDIADATTTPLVETHITFNGGEGDVMRRHAL